MGLKLEAEVMSGGSPFSLCMSVADCEQGKARLERRSNLFYLLLGLVADLLCRQVCLGPKSLVFSDSGNGIQSDLCAVCLTKPC